MKIDANAVDAVFRHCLWLPEEVASQQVSTDAPETLHGHRVPRNAVRVHGVRFDVGLHPDRLRSHEGEVRQWLMALPHEFRQSEGGGWTFLNACLDEDGNQWGEHINVEQLFTLGIGLGMVRE